MLGDYGSELIDSGFVNEREPASIMIFPQGLQILWDDQNAA